MITKIEIDGFKSFINQSFNVAPLTILAGMNSSGKSSFLQAVMFLCNARKMEKIGPLPGLISSLRKKVKLIRHDGKYSTEVMWGKDGQLTRLVQQAPGYDTSWFSYISASRLGPELQLPLSEQMPLRNVGDNGEFTLDLINRYSELKGLPNELQRHQNSSNVIRNISAWLSLISPGVEFEYDILEDLDSGKARYSGHRPTNVGFGLSYSLPIIANALIYAALIATQQTKSAILLVENPEAHLHPAGQTAMGEMLAQVANCGVQIFVETHSDHLLNGVRWAVKKGSLAHSKTAFHFFTYDFDEECSGVESPQIDENGYFDEWPEGFFDEYEKSLARLL